MDQIFTGVVGGLIGAAGLTLFFATLRSKSLFGALLFICILLGQWILGIYEDSWLPRLSALTTGWGLDLGLELTRPGILSLLITMVAALALAHFTGLIKYLGRCIDRLAALLSARFRRRPGSADPTDG